MLRSLYFVVYHHLVLRENKFTMLLFMCCFNSVSNTSYYVGSKLFVQTVHPESNHPRMYTARWHAHWQNPCNQNLKLTLQMQRSNIIPCILHIRTDVHNIGQQTNGYMK
ncbi:hypothetical protein C8R41DRAFT_121942 [Lentinula lateritia]|uniref:Secreted protein n=1 Tax=Lentinula lateritia TaxID=40482 RepID=A0ABQ8VSU9_9AGAR|nr:hypothetical protein C8R41DRAFT_121942 [Lentinula lateritia]